MHYVLDDLSLYEIHFNKFTETFNFLQSAFEDNLLRVHGYWDPTLNMDIDKIATGEVSSKTLKALLNKKTLSGKFKSYKNLNYYQSLKAKEFYFKRSSFFSEFLLPALRQQRNKIFLENFFFKDYVPQAAFHFYRGYDRRIFQGEDLLIGKDILYPWQDL